MEDIRKRPKPEPPIGDVMKSIANILGMDTALQIKHFCHDEESANNLQNLEISKIELPANGLEIAQKTDQSSTPIPFEIVYKNKYYLVFLRWPLKQNTSYILKGSWLDNLKKGVIILPKGFFIEIDTIGKAAAAAGGQKKTSKTRTDKTFYYRKRMYRVYQGLRGGYYIKVKGDWKAVPKHSMTNSLIKHQ